MDITKPPFRKLRTYAFDPSLSLASETAGMNIITYKVDWEELKPGPVGEYLEVIDYDPTVDAFYEPLNLDHPFLLAQDGVDPSESNPHFHQQMVYSVAMTTIKYFEQALGRKVLWSTRRLNTKLYESYVPKLRIYPHAMRYANAYYSPQKKALLFGYFSANPANPSLQMPGSLVFTCLSHDIIAHEVTHAILDGLHRNYNEPTNPDVLAFHEAFSDIVAIFQHFTVPEVLKHQIAATRGDLESQNLLGQLAQQFGAAVGCYGSLRDAIGRTDPETGKWKPTEPSTEDYQTLMEPHARGSILVAAIFEAFISIYKSRAADLLRISSNGTGILPKGELHPDLVNRLATEASKSAKHVLFMCIRALDYCPPVDITFGDYLRAIITADLDIVADDTGNYRLMFIEAFKRRGIYPKGIKTLSVESLRHTREHKLSDNTSELLKIISTFLREYRTELMYVTDREQIYKLGKEFMGAGKSSLHHRINIKFLSSTEFEKLSGLVLCANWKEMGIRTSTAYHNSEGPSFQITGLRLVSRVGPQGNQVNQILFSMIQRSGVIVRDGKFVGYYVPEVDEMPKGGFEIKGGGTLIFDLDSTNLVYAITKPLVCTDSNSPDDQVDLRRIINQYNYQMGAGLEGLHLELNEPFAFLHQ
jgi:hypothetical protein